MIIEKWFNEALENKIPCYNLKNTLFIFYKGFKITKHDSEYIIEDIRYNDFYNSVKEEHLKLLTRYGFVKGADIINYNRNIIRSDFYLKKLEEGYDEKEEYISNMKKNPSFYKKKLKNCQENIYKYIDLHFFYKAKIKQYNIKYEHE